VEVTENITGKVEDITAPTAGVHLRRAVCRRLTRPERGAALYCSKFQQLNVVVAVDELDISSVSIGQTADVAVDALPNTAFTGTVSRISQVGLQQGGVTTYNVTLSVANPAGLMDGMSANADIKTASKQNAVLVPVEALQTVGNDKYVTVITGTGVNMKTTQVKVTVGLQNETDVEITSGVSVGDDVVLSKVTSTSNIGGLRAMFGGGTRQQNNVTSGSSSSDSSASTAS